MNVPDHCPDDSGNGGGDGFGGGNGGGDGMGGGGGDTPVVPEPGSLLMLAVGSVLGGVGYLRRRRKQK